MSKRYFLAVYSIMVFAVLPGCKKGVIKSDAGTVSEGTFRYLRYVFYSEEKDLGIIIKLIKEEEAKGVLADKHGLKQNADYGRYKFLAQRRRYHRTAVKSWKEKLKKNFTMSDVLPEYDISIHPERAVAEILKNISRKGNRIELGDDNIVLGKWPEGKITLKMLRKIMLPREWNQLLSFREKPMLSSLRENLYRWVHKVVNEKIIDRFNADREELSRFDHNHVAGLFLTVKYGMADEGIYPAETIKIKFSPKELFNHFQIIKFRFLKVRQIKVQYTAVKDKKTAGKFFVELKKGKDFIRLAEKYGVNRKFKNSARPHLIMGYDTSLPLDKRENRKYIDKLIIDLAQRGIYAPEAYNSRYGLIIIRILNIIRVKSNIEYKDYTSEVKHDLTRKLLLEQYPIDIQDTIEEINVRTYLNGIK